jgi:Fe-S cluster biosynthesis and repair protein YggX
MNIFELVKNKLGIETYNDLNEEERKYIGELEKTISESKITDDKVKEWLKQQIVFIEEDLCLPDNSRNKDLYLKARLRNFRMLLNYLESEKITEQQIVSSLK